MSLLIRIKQWKNRHNKCDGRVVPYSDDGYHFVGYCMKCENYLWQRNYSEWIINGKWISGYNELKRRVFLLKFSMIPQEIGSGFVDAQGAYHEG